MQVTVQVQVNKAIERALVRAPEAVQKHLSQGFKAWGIRAAGFAKKRSPIDTGRLRRSIHFKLLQPAQGFEGYIGSDVIYARIHEYGGTILPRRKRILAWVTRGDRPTTAEGWRQARREGRARFARKVQIREKPYVRPGVQQAIPELDLYMARAFKKALGDVGLTKG